MKDSVKAPLGRPATGSRRGFLKAFGAAAAATFWSDQQLEAYQQNVNTNSKASDLKITDMRVATVVGAPMRCPIIRIDTNQGVYGLGEVRDGASKMYALMLKSRILGENPCNVDKIFRTIKQFGGHARQGAVCAASRWRAWTSPARRGACRAGRCSAAGFVTASASTPTRPRRTTRRNRPSGSKRGWRAASRT